MATLDPRALDAWRNDRVFPVLTPAQIAAIAAHGRRRKTTRGDVLLEVGDRILHFFVVVSGEIEALRPVAASETTIVVLGAGQFTGETSLIAGRRALSRLRVREAGEVIEVEREQLLTLVQTNAELSEILMRAFSFVARR